MTHIPLFLLERFKPSAHGSGYNSSCNRQHCSVALDHPLHRPGDKVRSEEGLREDYK